MKSSALSHMTDECVIGQDYREARVVTKKRKSFFG